MCVVLHSFGDRAIYCPQRCFAGFRGVRERRPERLGHEPVGLAGEREARRLAGGADDAARRAGEPAEVVALAETMEYHAHVRLRRVA